MFSLDVVRWRDKKQQQDTKRLPSRELHRPKSKPSLHDARHEEAPGGRNGDGDEASLPNVYQESQAQRDKRLKRLYGRTQKEMHDAYVDRVDQWMQTAPKQQWVKDYAKQTSYSKQYVPRERYKTKELGGPMLKTNLYTPRAVYKGGGDRVKALVDEDPSAPDEEREQYKESIRFIERSREAEKEIQPPMSIPKNKRLECAHYFVEDVICSPDNQQLQQRPATQHLARPNSRKQLHPLNASAHTMKLVEPPEHYQYDPLPTTAEYVALPQWRVHSPEKWMSNAFVSTVTATNAHTAQNRSITGTHYAQSVLILETFVPPHKRLPLSPKDAALNPRDHERRAQTAAAMLRETRSPRRADRKYFGSMWTQPGSPSRVREYPPVVKTPSPEKPLAEAKAKGDDSPTPKNGGRILSSQLRETASRLTPSPRRSKSRAGHTVLVRSLLQTPPPPRSVAAHQTAIEPPQSP